MADEKYMQRAIQLAQHGVGHVSPNPMVGCVIVHQDEIIGEGWHRKYGEAHAEVNTINSVKDQSRLKESTLYVTLEPCAHFGKTPPCADLLAEEQIKRVVIATTDPNPKVAGKGINKLKTAGIEVDIGILEQKARELNRRFFTAFIKKRPYIILKWAQTKDGFIARKDFSSKWISNEYSRQLVHKWRAEEDAILIGSNTAVHDDPSLNVRDWHGKDPLRIVIDRHLKLPQPLKLFNDGRKTICYNYLKSEQAGALTYYKAGETRFLQYILEDLGKRGIQSVIVEGGAAVINALVKKNFWDEARIFISKNTFKKGIAAPKLQGNLVSETFVADNELLIFSNKTNEWLKH
jgi:diaminohydroxyphosphoribosylaminopyrimidine deaminase/5-amino-6-(5-phosphoribosylamino)uracil reductase